MADLRVQKLAHVLVQYSLALRPGDKTRITANTISLPLVREVYREAVRAGALVTVRLTSDDLDEIRLREASEEQLGYISELARQEYEYFDATLSIWGDENTKSLSGIEPRRIAIEQQARGPLLERMLARMASGELRWCGTQFPTQASAQDAGMSLSDYEDFVYNAGLLDCDDPAAEWQRVSNEQQRIATFLQQHDEIRIVAPGTDLTYRVGGRIWSNAAGRENFPDGEIYSGPIEDSVNGTVEFSYPAVYHGNEVEQVRLRFEHGKAVEATASRGQDFLLAQLDQDAGARFVGEVAFGLNYGIQRFTRNTLFDEKIGGTMHMALGQSLPETGGKNTSALHWDMVCDLRAGKVYADGKLCYADGKFTI